MAKYVAWYLPPNAGWSQPVQVLDMPVPPLYPTPTLCRTTSINTFHHSTSLLARRVHFPMPPTVSCSQASSGDATCNDHTNTCTHTIHLPTVPVAHKSACFKCSHKKQTHTQQNFTLKVSDWGWTCFMNKYMQVQMLSTRGSYGYQLAFPLCPSGAQCKGLYGYPLAFPPCLLDAQHKGLVCVGFWHSREARGGIR
jgi:hypothetical protein